MLYEELITGAAIRIVNCTLDSVAAHAFEAYQHAQDNGQRHGHIALGDKFFCSVPHADGIGSWRTNLVVWERLPRSRCYAPMDFSTLPCDHKTLRMLARLFNASNDWQLLCCLFYGVDLPGVTYPLQIRIGHNILIHT